MFIFAITSYLHKRRVENITDKYFDKDTDDINGNTVVPFL